MCWHQCAPNQHKFSDLTNGLQWRKGSGKGRKRYCLQRVSQQGHFYFPPTHPHPSPLTPRWPAVAGVVVLPEHNPLDRTNPQMYPVDAWKLPLPSPSPDITSPPVEVPSPSPALLEAPPTGLPVPGTKPLVVSDKLADPSRTCLQTPKCACAWAPHSASISLQQPASDVLQGQHLRVLIDSSNQFVCSPAPHAQQAPATTIPRPAAPLPAAYSAGNKRKVVDGFVITMLCVLAGILLVPATALAARWLWRQRAAARQEYQVGPGGVLGCAGFSGAQRQGCSWCRAGVQLVQEDRQWEVVALCRMGCDRVRACAALPAVWQRGGCLAAGTPPPLQHYAVSGLRMLGVCVCCRRCPSTGEQMAHKCSGMQQRPLLQPPEPRIFWSTVWHRPASVLARAGTAQHCLALAFQLFFPCKGSLCITNSFGPKTSEQLM